MGPASMVVWGGLLLGIGFGAVANRANFCTMGAISDVVNMGHWGRVRMWLLAVAVAMIGAGLLQFFELADLTKSVYYRANLPWLSLLLGGLLFGVGMTIASGCPNKNLVRLGGGSLRSLVVLVFLGLSAYMTLKGLFGQWRASYLDPVSVASSTLGLSAQGLPQLFTKLTGVSEKTGLAVTVALVSAALLIFVFKDKRFRANALQMGGAVALGLLVAAGWYLTGNLGYGENPETLEIVYFATNSRTIESMSFVAPIAYNLELLMLWTDKSLHASFGIATALGVVLGSFVYSIAAGKFLWEGFASMQDLGVHLIGAVLMGFGGVTAIGCTIGQGMSGLSSLALGSFLAMTGIVVGAVVTMKWQQR